jgi:hypothetical protein
MHVLVMAYGELVVSDGSAKLRRYTWADPKDQANYNLIKSVELPAPVIGAPLLLPADAQHPTPRIITVLADQQVLLLDGAKLEQKHKWKLHDGKVTTGPYLAGNYVACVQDGKRLAWLDVNKEKGQFQYYEGAEDNLVGQPQLVGGMFVVADNGGKFVGVDPASGKVLRDEGYTLNASVAPASAPAAFGTDHAMTPLTDGTVFILALDRLRASHAAAGTKSPADKH